MIKSIAPLLKQVPFVPFSIVTTSGHEYRVDHPENGAVVGSFVVVSLPEEDTLITLTGLHISGVKVRDTSGAAFDA